MYLYEIPQAYKTILDNADPETGEIDYEALDMLEDSLHSKADTYAKIIRSLSAQSAAVESEIERLEALKTANDNKVARLKENLMKAMESMDDEKFKTDLFSFSIRQASSQPLEIDETQEIPIKWCKTTVTPDKARIKEALKKGEKLGFAKLGERKQFLMIR